ncbi:MAG: hypothetical protein ABSA59_06990 [Terriglobia bacterium]|jgi:hypothetical protein
MGDSRTLDALLTFYESARKEMFLRMREREIATYAWMAVLGTVLTATLASKPPNMKLLLALPLLGVAIAFRIAQHETLIATLATYCKEELGPEIRRQAGTDVRHWDESHALAQYQRSVVGARSIVNLLLVVAPCAVGLVLNASAIAAGTTTFWAWAVSCLLTAACAWLLVGSMVKRLAAAMREPGPDNPKT